MKKPIVFQRIQLVFGILCAIIALVIIIDYTFNSSTSTEKVLAKERQVENKYSFTGNQYYARYLATATQKISVSKELNNTVERGDMITFTTSLWFNEINRVTVPSLGVTEVYSFRTMFGLLVPLLVLILLGIGCRLKSKVSTLVFVSEVVLLADVIFLIL